MDPEIPRAWLTLACGFAVVVGHVYPVWFGFRGGKGVATMVGVVGALDPRLLIPVIGSWFIVLVLTGYVGLASMLAGAALVVFVYLVEPGNAALLCFCVAIEIFVVFTHRGNIARMRAGNEHRVQRLWLFRSRAA
jgi:glycerol-3-phosphate acyltransferase PlsY